MTRLYTFVISHFSEKARWALDLAGVPYEEEYLLPGPHLFTVRRLAKASTVPLLVHDGTAIQGSSAIIDYAEQRLGGRSLTPAEPAAAARAWAIEALADHAFGLGIQRIVYASLLGHREVVIDLWAQRGASYARPLLRLLFPLLRIGVRRAYGVRPDRVVRAKDRLRRAMDETDRELRDRPYLLGDAPCRADVTVAALLAPLFRPAGHVTDWPREVPPDFSDFVHELEGRPTCALVHRMYREHRR